MLMAICEHDPHLLAERPGLLIIPDKGYTSAKLDTLLAERGARLLRPSYATARPSGGEHLLKPIRQLIESVNATLKGQLDLEFHGGRTPTGVAHPYRSAHSGPDHGHLAQPRDCPAHHPVTDRL
nr:hypothetical protein [Spongiactinospora gelatinilytica]